MAMAIHSAKLATENTIHFLENRIDRSTLENEFKRLENFKKQIAAGRLRETITT
jgi:hypothetical protein